MASSDTPPAGINRERRSESTASDTEELLGGSHQSEEAGLDSECVCVCVCVHEVMNIHTCIILSINR